MGVFDENNIHNVIHLLGFLWICVKCIWLFLCIICPTWELKARMTWFSIPLKHPIDNAMALAIRSGWLRCYKGTLGSVRPFIEQTPCLLKCVSSEVGSVDKAFTDNLYWAMIWKRYMCHVVTNSNHNPAWVFFQTETHILKKCRWATPSYDRGFFFFFSISNTYATT